MTQPHSTRNVQPLNTQITESSGGSNVKKGEVTGEKSTGPLISEFVFERSKAEHFLFVNEMRINKQTLKPLNLKNMSIT